MNGGIEDETKESNPVCKFRVLIRSDKSGSGMCVLRWDGMRWGGRRLILQYIDKAKRGPQDNGNT